MAKVANLMANHNGNPTAVASLYDEKISVVKDENTVVLATVDTDTGINDLCGNEWTYYNGTDTTVMPSIGTYNSKRIFNVSASLRYTADIDVELGGDVPFSIDFYTVFSYARPSTTVKWYTVPIVKLIADDDSEISIQAGQVWYPEGDNLAGNVTQRGYAGYRVYFPEGYAGWGAGSTYYSTQSTHTPYVVGYFKLSYEANTVRFFPRCTGTESGYPLAGTYGADFDSVAKRRYVKIQIGGGTLTSAQIRDVRLTKGVALWNSSTSSQTPSNTLLYPSAGLPVKGNLCVRALTPYAANTKILLHFDDSDNPYIDECGNTWAKSGSPQIVDGYFDKALSIQGGESNCLYTKTTFQLGGQDFTIDFWVFIQSGTTQWGTFFKFSSSVNDYNNSTTLRFNRYNQPLQFVALNTACTGIITLENDTWYHIACTYKYDIQKLYCFVNGVKDIELDLDFPRTSYAYCVLGRLGTGGRHFYGYIDDVRFVDGQALWTSDFTPPDKPHSFTQTLYAPLVLENSPPADSQTISLLHFDDPDNPYKDECSNQWHQQWMNNNGTTQTIPDTNFSIDTDTAKFGSSSFRLTTKSSNSSTLSYQGLLTFGGRDYTVDYWATGFMRVNFCARAALNNVWEINLNGKHFSYHSSGKTLKSSVVFNDATDTWRHFAVVYNYSANTLTVYEDGVKKGTFQLSTRHERVERHFGFYTSWATNSNHAPRIDEFRIVDGLQVWTEDFTPPTQPYTLDTYNGKNPPCIGVRNQGNNFYTV